MTNLSLINLLSKGRTDPNSKTLPTYESQNAVKNFKDGIKSAVYETTKDTTFDDLRKFQCFLGRNFKEFDNYGKIRPVSNQRDRLYGVCY